MPKKHLKIPQLKAFYYENNNYGKGDMDSPINQVAGRENIIVETLINFINTWAVKNKITHYTVDSMHISAAGSLNGNECLNPNYAVVRYIK